MGLHKTFTNNKRGFTLIEVLVVMAILTIVLSSMLFFNLDTYRGDAFRAEAKLLQTALQTARANAMNNINQNPHGVALHPDGYDGYVAFEGVDYAHREISTSLHIPASYTVTFDPVSPQEIVFLQLSGDSNFQGEIVLVDGERNASTSIHINYEGAINY